MRSRFLSITLVEYGCSVSDKFYRLQHFWYYVVITCFARFPKFNRQIQKVPNHSYGQIRSIGLLLENVHTVHVPTSNMLESVLLELLGIFSVMLL